MSITIALAAYRFVNGDTAFNISQIERALQAAHGRAEGKRRAAKHYL